MAATSPASRAKALLDRIEKVTEEFETLHSRLSTASADLATGAATTAISASTADASSSSSGGAAGGEKKVESFSALSSRLEAVVSQAQSLGVGMQTAAETVAAAGAKDSSLLLSSPPPPPPPSSSATTTPQTQKTEQQQSSSSSGAKAAAAAAAAGKSPMISPSKKKNTLGVKVEGFEHLMSNFLVPFLQHSAVLGGGVARQAVAVGKAFQSQREILRYVSENRPASMDDEKLTSLLQASSEAVDEHQRDIDSSSPHFHHIAMVAGGISALTWVFVPDEPASVVGEMLNAIPTFGAKIQKGSSQDVSFYDSFRNLLRALFEFVKDKFPKGLLSYPSAEEETEESGEEGEGEKLTAFDTILESFLVKFLAAAEKCGGLPLEQAQEVQRAFQFEREILKATEICKKPSRDEMMSLLSKMSVSIEKIENFPRGARDDLFFNHLNLVGGGCSALWWLTIELNPSVTVADILNGLPVFSEKIARDPKRPAGSDELVASFSDLMKSLHQYVKIHHPKGVTWNSDGISVVEFLESQE